MIHFDLPKEKSSIIKVIGVGGGGCNAVNYMYSQQIEGVNFIICNTDAQSLANTKVPNKIQLGPQLTQGLGAGANPEIGRQATEESLNEIKSILEVNTKMAFITVGMGGGTGTGGAPIISKICKDLGILTVGIVTTPFAYEGKKRQQQAEEGIKNMKQYVDTLLVISNDKLRHQFGNLKMREAFAKADNVLATAAKCITDVINSNGQINVDFADVCTVMRNGGVAILGSAAASGENRAQKAIEEAMNSPLLNDNDIHGAKWILLNINSAEGEHEFTMDEVEVIQHYILSHAGDNTDVILGMGYDNSLDNKIGITLIATGFEHKDPFTKAITVKPEPQKEEKIIMVLGVDNEEKLIKQKQEEIKKEEEVKIDPMAPTLVEEPMDEQPKAAQIQFRLFPEPGLPIDNTEQEKSPVIHWELNMDATNISGTTKNKTGKTTVGKLWAETKDEDVNPALQSAPVQYSKSSLINDNTSQLSAAAGGYLARPSNIYAESKAGVSTPKHSAEEPKHPEPVSNKGADGSHLRRDDMQLIFRDDIPAADEPRSHHAQTALSNLAEEPRHGGNEADEQQRRAAERLQKLRNLSFNINGTDPNNEFETVPAYIRRNMELYNTAASVETFYSNYEVKTDENNQAQISTINTFLDGKKPD